MAENYSFFSNKKCEHFPCHKVSDKIAESLYNQLKEIKEKEIRQAETKTTKDVINIARDNYRKTEREE